MFFTRLALIHKTFLSKFASNFKIALFIMYKRSQQSKIFPFKILDGG